MGTKAAYASMFASVTNASNRAVFLYSGCSKHASGQSKHCSSISGTMLTARSSVISNQE